MSQYKPMTYPQCDKCGEPIILFGKYITENGIRYYVHEKYTPETGVCKG